MEISGLLRIIAVSTGIWCCAWAGESFALNLIRNGNFESGDLDGWQVFDQPGSGGSWYLSTPGGAFPRSDGYTSPSNSRGGQYYAVADQLAPASNVLLQRFFIPDRRLISARLSFQLFSAELDSRAFVGPQGLDFRGGRNQHVRVDLLDDLADPFQTVGGVVDTYFVGLGGLLQNQSYVTYSFDITESIRNFDNYQLRFALATNQGHLWMGVDNVRIDAVLAEPSTLMLMLCVSLSGALLPLGRRTIPSEQRS